MRNTTQTVQMEEAPASPRSAAIYYWGGDWGRDDGARHAPFGGGGGNAKGVGGWDDARSDHADLWDSTFRRREPFEPRRRSFRAVRFHLALDDEGDADHWMYAPDLSATLSSSEDDEETSVPELPLAADDKEDDFSDPTDVDDGDFDAIPIIDLSQPKQVYARQIGDACRDVGFFYIINHGVDSQIMGDVMEKSKRFFGLDLERKLDASNNGTTNAENKGYRGYFEIGGEDLENKDGTRDLVAEEGGEPENGGATKNGQKRTGDFKEGFDCGLESDNDDKNDACIKFFGKNLWPDESANPSIIGFHKTLMSYQAELIGLADELLLALGKSLGDKLNSGENGDDVAEDYFIHCTRNPMCTLRLLHYPPATERNATSQGCGAHTDYGCFTILQQDSIGGLQVRNRKKHWIDAKPLKGSFVINVGDMLSNWTNGEYASTVHRVISPSSSSDRYSVPFFFNPDPDAVVKPLAGLGVDGGVESDNYDGDGDTKLALEILRARYEGTFGNTK